MSHLGRKGNAWIVFGWNCMQLVLMLFVKTAHLHINDEHERAIEANCVQMKLQTQKLFSDEKKKTKTISRC